MLEKPLERVNSSPPPPPPQSKNRVNTDLIICHSVNFVVSSSLCLSQSKSNHKITRSARFTIFLQDVIALIVLFQTTLKHINSAVTFFYLILVTWFALMAIFFLARVNRATCKFQFLYSLMQVSVSSITIPPRTPGDLHQKFAPTLGLLHPSFCPGGRGFVGAAPEEWAFVYKRCLPFLKFSL